MDMYIYDQLFLHIVADVVHLEKPIYEFEWAAGRSGGAAEAEAGTGMASLLEEGRWGSFEVDRLSDLVPLPFSAASARTVLCLQVLDHLAHPLSAVQEMERILMPGGVLVVIGRFSSGKQRLGGVSEPPSQTWPKASPQEESFGPSTPGGFVPLLGSFPAMVAAWSGGPSPIQTFYAVAKKAPVEESFLDRLGRLGQLLTERFSEAPQPVRDKRAGWLRKWWKRWSWLPWPFRPTPLDSRPAEEFSLVYTFSCGHQTTPGTLARMSVGRPLG